MYNRKLDWFRTSSIAQSIPVRRVSSFGFTIVELLIVIVVIGILAALVLNAFSGAQAKARNAARIDAADAWVKALDVYFASAPKGSPPAPFNYCLGTGYPGGQCYDLDSGPRSESTAAMSVFRAGGIQLNSFPSTPVIAANGHRMVGGLLSYGAYTDGIGGVVQPQVIIYFLEGTNQDCGSSQSVVSNGVGSNRYSPGPYISSDGKMTTCYLTVKYNP